MTRITGDATILNFDGF
jgi:hypothetical protein